MKNVNTSVVLWFAMMFLTNLAFGQAQPPNSGFETWTSTFPSNWNSIDQVTHVSKITPGHAGSNAAKLETKSVILFGNVPGLLTLGTFDSNTNNINGGVSFTERPDSVVFWYKYYPQAGDTGFVAFALFNNADTVASPYVYLTTSQSTWKRYSFPVVYKSSATPTLMNIGFLSSLKSSAKAGTYLIIDDVQLIYNWTFVCNNPTALNATNITVNSAALNWTAGGTETSWQIQYGSAGFTLGSGTIVNASSKPYTITGLLDDSNYSFYVKANCSNGLISDWAGPYNFTTLSSCLSPTSLTASAITTSSASLNWTQGSTETQWILEWGQSGFAHGAGTTVNLTSKPYSLTGLQESTTYSYYVKANCGGVKQSPWAGPFSFTTLSTCPPPTALTATNIGTNSASLSWISGGSESQWIVEWGIAGFNLGSGVTENVVSLPLTLNTLANGTQYNYYVKADCGGGKKSTWAGPFTFTTNSVSCNISISNFPWNESFEDGLIPNCWTQVYENGTVSWMVGAGNNSNHPSTAQDGLKNAFIKINNPANKGKITKLITPQLDLSNLANIQLSFWHVQQAWSADQDELRVYYKTSPTGTWVLLNAYTSVINSWTQHTINLPNKSSQYYIAFESTTKYGYGIGIDNVTVSGTAVTCTNPNNLNAATITTNSANLSWTETGTATEWILEWGLQGFASGSGTSVNLTAANYALSGLSPNTSYQFYVKANCGGQTSSQAGPFTFTTLQNPCVVSTFPWTEGFEGGVIPNCWSESLSTGANHWQYLKGNGTSYPTNSHTGVKNAVLKRTTTGADTTKLITPAFDLSHLENPILKLWHTQAAWATDQDQLKIYYKNSTSGVWTLLVAYTASVTTWTERTIPLPNKSSDYTIAFEGIAKYGYGACLDDISITGTVVTCAAPTNLSASNLEESSAIINWTENNGATTWQIEYGTQGFTPGSGTIVNVTTKPYTITGLNANTYYTYYVKSNCNTSNTSSLSDPYTFKTTCGSPISIFPWNEGFEGGVIPACWSEQLVSGTIGWEYANGGYSTGGINSNPSAAHTGSFNARFRNNNNITADINKLVTPAFNLTSISNPTLKFWHTQADWSGDQDELRVYYKTSATGTWILLNTYTASITAWTQETIILPNPSAEYYIAFEGTAMYGHGACIDDVNINGTTVLSPAKEIISFSIPQQVGNTIINSTNAIISLKVAYGTSLTNLTPTITVSPQATINPATQVARDFTNAVNYVVTAQNASTKTWTVTVTVAPFVSSEAEIINFTHASQANSAVINSANATVDLQIYEGTGLTSLSPNITISTGAGIVPINGTLLNFTNPVVYTVTAADSTKKDWTATITEIPLLSNEAEILTFVLTEQTGGANINSQDTTINIEVNNQTSLSSLSPVITISNNASINPPSNATLSFDTPVQYTVTAENGTSQKIWTVTVTKAPSNAAEILTFAFPEETVAATINAADTTISIEVAYTADLANLTPTITISQGATINPLNNIANDFTLPVNYTVTAEDGITQKIWTVIVTKAPQSADVIVKWDFPNTPDDNIADDGIISNLTKTINTTAAATPSYSEVGASTNCAKVLAWDNGSGTKYWTVEFSTLNYKDITVSSKQNSTSRGPKNFKLQYRIDINGTWTDVPNGVITVGSNWTGGFLNNLALPIECTNQTSVFLRWIMTSNTSVYLLAVNADAASLIDDIIIKGMFDITLSSTELNLTAYKLYPNPVNEYLNIDFGENISQGKVELINIEGKTIDMINIENNNHIQINTSNYATGLYIVRIISAERISYVKIVKK